MLQWINPYAEKIAEVRGESFPPKCKCGHYYTDWFEKSGFQQLRQSTNRVDTVWLYVIPNSQPPQEPLTFMFYQPFQCWVTGTTIRIGWINSTSIGSCRRVSTKV